MKKFNSLFAMAALSALLLLGSGCSGPGTATPAALLTKYFSSAVKQDYATTYNCYYAAYRARVNREEYVKHRKEASVLQSFKIISMKQIDNDTAEARVLLTFAPSEKLNRKEPVSTTVTEDMVREGGQWKIKVWSGPATAA